jgi:hypothetical protein
MVPPEVTNIINTYNKSSFVCVSKDFYVRHKLEVEASGTIMKWYIRCEKEKLLNFISDIDLHLIDT